ncbi:nuclease-related domain-containing DEAD/DEAH box helicase [Synechococcus elongatus]|uniref:nuclease-related domain-containing DEAD/DEAH box helicase n=1 Tax=Synechococcus elongatus TaxID=32046 RepID=UPI0030D3D82D
MALCFPSLTEVERFRIPLEPGEKYLLSFLIENLDDTYEIYVQPFLNGDRPDIVIVKPNAGVLIIEVKDWNLKHYKNNFGGSKSWNLAKNNTTIKSPISQVETYKANFYNLHINYLFELNVKNKKHFSIVQTAVYFHNETTRDAQSFCFNVKYTHIFGYDSLNARDFQSIIIESRLHSSSSLFNEQLYLSFKRFLKPPEHTPEMGKDIQYTKKQKELIQSKANLRQKIRGVAGCGKTKVLAGRAVSAYARTRSVVLILTFNITLRNYIHDRVSEVKKPFSWSCFEISNYHQFFKTQANNYGLDYGENLLTAADNQHFFEPVKNDIDKYKVILVDEVQDYKSQWLRLLDQYFLAENGEIVFFGDEKQNIYGRQMGDDKFPTTPILGRWNELNKSFRMDITIFRIAQEFQKLYFQERYHIDKDTELVQKNLFESTSLFRYYQTKERETVRFMLSEIKRLNIHPNDLVILAPTHETIRNLEYNFRSMTHEKTTHAGERQEEYEDLIKRYPDQGRNFKIDLETIRRGRKLHFWGNAGTTKFSTIYSFKGWEAHTLILVISNILNIEEGESLEELIYTGITRAKNNLIILNETEKYQDFFSRYVDNH